MGQSLLDFRAGARQDGFLLTVNSKTRHKVSAEEFII